MSLYGQNMDGRPRYTSRVVKTAEQMAQLKAELAERMQTAFMRRYRVSREAQVLMDKITNYWKSKGYQPPVLWLENNSLNPDLTGIIRSNMIGGQPQVKLHD